jgi:protein O-mannosyl-transferase
MMRHELWVCLMLMAATVAVYEPVRHHDFVDFDDAKYVFENPEVRGGLTLAGVTWAFTTSHESNWHPLTWLSHMLDVELFGLNAGSHHLVNLLLHAANTVLLFVVLRSMTGALWRSALVAALFGLHPVHVESVAWVSERKDVLSTLFWMLTLMAYVRYFRRPTAHRYALIALSLTLGLMAKPMLVTLPFVLLLLDVWPLGRLPMARSASAGETGLDAASGPGSLRSEALRLVWEKVPLFALSAASAIVTFAVQQHGGAVTRIDRLPLWARVVNAFRSYARYLDKTLWPSDLAIFYPYTRVFFISDLVIAALTLVGISLLVWSEARRRPYLLVGWLWYVGTLVPVIGLVQVGSQSMADRYTYIPVIGIFLMVAWGVPDLVARWPSMRPILAAAAGVMLVGCMLATWFQVQHWHNTVTLFEHASRVTRDNYLAHHNLGVALGRQGRLDESARHLREAVRIQPYHPQMHTRFALVLARQGKIDESIAEFREALRISPDDVDAYIGLGAALTRGGEIDEGIAQLRAALRIKPDSAEAHNVLGVALAEQGKTEEAIAHFWEALRIRPGYAEADRNLLKALARKEGAKTP